MAVEGTDSQVQERLDGQGAVLAFEPSDAKLDVGVGKSAHGPMTDMALVYSLKLASREELALSTGETAREMPLTLRVTTARELKDPDCAGAAYYSERWEAEGFSDPARIHFDVDVPSERFGLLLALARAGRHPRRISLQVLGMKYAPFSDGSVKEWDTAEKSKQKLLISYIDFSFALTTAEERAKESALAMDVRREMIGVLQAQRKDMRAALAWMVGILLAALALLLWRML
jgi:hypothetical protein